MGPLARQEAKRGHGDHERRQVDAVAPGVASLGACAVEDRAADTWEPLVAVADLAGGVEVTLSERE